MKQRVCACVLMCVRARNCVHNVDGQTSEKCAEQYDGGVHDACIKVNVTTSTAAANPCRIGKKTVKSYDERPVHEPHINQMARWLRRSFSHKINLSNEILFGALVCREQPRKEEKRAVFHFVFNWRIIAISWETSVATGAPVSVNSNFQLS